mmetsp:Transcript_11633/g.31734  ORF Transcript_11633/g.31734 Transcript_11633/m.31734 type:complete len:80 (-) Transcript_11633:60-299(-)
MTEQEENLPQMTKQQKEAQEYVVQHGLDRLVTKLMNGVLAEKPADPKVFMMKWLADRSSHDQLYKAGLQTARSNSPRKR